MASEESRTLKNEEEENLESQILNFHGKLPKTKEIDPELTTSAFLKFASEIVDFEWKHHKKQPIDARLTGQLATLEDLKLERKLVRSADEKGASEDHEE